MGTDREAKGRERERETLALHKHSMQNEAGKKVDLYIPRKCSATSRLIGAKDHASVQFNIGQVNEDGVFTGAVDTVALCGFIRSRGEADDAVNRLAIDKGIMHDL